MSNTIDLPSYGGYHFGSITRIKQFIGCYFEERNPTTNIINKAIIMTIDYKPDQIYLSTDGHAGNCWTVYIADSREINGELEIIYNFRNMRDLVMHYEKEGFKFV